MQHSNQKRNWLSWLLPVLASTALTLAIIGGFLWAQSAGAIPLGLMNTDTITGTIAYQGRLTDSDGSPMTGKHGMRFALYNQESSGEAVWSEDHSFSDSVEFINGLFNVELGSINPLDQSVIAEDNKLYLGISIGTGDEMTPRVELGSVPFAFHAKYATHALSAENVTSYEAVKQVDLGDPTTYTVSTRRYHVEATKAQVDNTVPLDMEIVNELCRDEDGCLFTLSMRDWSDTELGVAALRGPYRFFMSKTSTRWRFSTISNMLGMDGDGVATDIFETWGCHFTDGEYVNGIKTDNSVQLGLLNSDSSFKDPDTVCILTMDD